jgi:two-component system chemotaxis response regulator CheB
MINILIADDSPTDAAILKSLFANERNMHVVGWARDGLEAIEMTEKYRPDLVTMDIKMPKMDGYQAIDIIMTKTPTPIVVISSLVGEGYSDVDSEATVKALEAGALTVLAKPVNIQSPLFEITRRHMIDTIASMAEIKVITKRRIGKGVLPQKLNPVKYGDFELVVLGSSVGGPQVLKQILSHLPSNFPVPIVVVQHMSPGFIPGFTKWLNSYVDLKVKLAENGEVLLPGVVYFAPDQTHFEVSKKNNLLTAALVKGEPISGFCPSITMLMKSVVKYSGVRAVSGLLTGMGSDGAEGMLSLKQHGSHTFIQDEESCVVFGMANVAQSIGAVDRIVKLDKIAEYLIMVTSKKPTIS